ncbi:hypothetical protein ESCO_000623 [Escovopsis weberi]|uniref:DUF4048 domain-containing protein n=1 Tax=Escovopsis weberi TaxID=150374 RepID=A0A0N0RTH5_ESCWE|nr:hypothetical protein ESCO_000623 [Escovopsis weberi]
MDQALQSCADGRGGSGGGGRDPTSVAQSPAAPASTVSTSIPPTPLETSNGGDPHTASDFIIAIAAQERRVFELREELARAETELAQLKKQWTAEEVYRKKSDSQRTDPYRTVAAADDDVFVATKRSIELDRRKLLIQTQQGSQTPSNRKVLRGSHARTLSLLSPSKGEGGFSIGDESRTESILSPSMEQRAAQIANPHVTKRQSWQARPQHSQQASSSGISSLPQMVEDFRDGFRAFVEDIKQITIGDEPVTGPTSGSGSGSGSGNEQRPTAKVYKICALERFYS